MGNQADQIKESIEATREEMSRTVREIGNRIDVPHRVKGAVQKQRERWFRNRNADEMDEGAERREPSEASGPESGEPGAEAEGGQPGPAGEGGGEGAMIPVAEAGKQGAPPMEKGGSGGPNLKKLFGATFLAGMASGVAMLAWLNRIQTRRMKE